MEFTQSIGVLSKIDDVPIESLINYKICFFAMIIVHCKIIIELKMSSL